MNQDWTPNLADSLPIIVDTCVLYELPCNSVELQTRLVITARDLQLITESIIRLVKGEYIVCVGSKIQLTELGHKAKATSLWSSPHH